MSVPFKFFHCYQHDLHTGKLKRIVSRRVLCVRAYLADLTGLLEVKLMLTADIALTLDLSNRISQRHHSMLEGMNIHRN